MRQELESMETNGIWELTELPPERKTIQNRWTFKFKWDENGNITRY